MSAESQREQPIRYRSEIALVATGQVRSASRVQEEGREAAPVEDEEAIQSPARTEYDAIAGVGF